MFLGIDLGTGSVKAMLIDAAGAIITEASRPYPVLSLQPGYAETPPAAWWAATIAAVRECCAGRARQVRGVGLSGQAHGLVALGADKAPLRAAMLWADQRATDEMAAVLALPDSVRRPLANPVIPGMAGLSLLWLRRNEPETSAAIRHIASPKDWLRLLLTGELATEPSDASMTLLYDIQADGWANDFVDALEIDPAILPPIIDSAAEAGRLTAAAAAALDLPVGLPVAAGLSDTAACLLGLGQIRPGATVLQVGSGIQIMAVTSAIEPGVQPFYNSYRGVDRSLYVMAALQNGGTVFEWARTMLSAAWPELYHGAFETGEGNGGVVFLPYAAGERAPLLDPNATAAFLDMRLGCSRNQVFRALFEGVALAVRDSWDALKHQGVIADQMLLTGGGSTDPRWRQLLADIVGVPLIPVIDRGNATLGACYLGGVVAGCWPRIADIPFDVSEPQRIEPAEFPGLDVLLARFRGAYRGLRQS